MKTATQLYAEAIGQPVNYGESQCYYCGGACDEQHEARKYIKATFTALSSVGCPESDYVCLGCISASNEKLVMPHKNKPQKTRNYSWVVTTKATPYTKANREELYRICIEPPEPPFAISLATSGQKNILYLAPANYSRERISVQLEEETVSYRVSDLIEACELFGTLMEAVGRTALENGPSVGAAISLSKAGLPIELINHWEQVYRTPLGRLALFVTPTPEKPSVRDNRQRSVSTAVSRTDSAKQQQLFG